MDGAAPVTFTDTTRVYIAQLAGEVLGYEDLTQGVNILDAASAQFSTYDLTTAIGLITGSSLAFNPGNSFPTNGAAFILTATIPAVPEPVPPVPSGRAAARLNSRRANLRVGSIDLRAWRVSPGALPSTVNNEQALRRAGENDD